MSDTYSNIILCLFIIVILSTVGTFSCNDNNQTTGIDSRLATGIDSRLATGIDGRLPQSFSYQAEVTATQVNDLFILLGVDKCRHYRPAVAGEPAVPYLASVYLVVLDAKKNKDSCLEIRQ